MRKPMRRKVTPEIRKRMLELYETMRSAKKVGMEIDISPTTVVRVLKEEGVSIRALRGKTCLERFLDYAIVNSDPECWGWRGWINKRGYAYFHRRREDGSFITCKAYRWSYEHYVGPIPEGMEIDHLCRNTGCVNPAHLEPVTRRENVLRSPDTISGAAIRKTECKRGHPFDEENTAYNKHGHRHCKTCQREATRRSVAKKKTESAIPFFAGNSGPETEET